MKFYEYNFIGDDFNKCVVEWAKIDSVETYQANLKNHKLNDWYYSNREISYSFNANGHRCKNITDIDLENYIITTGASSTVGVGLELEKTYSYLISDSLKCDYYNLSVGATGIDVLIHNLTIWLSVIKKKPKAIILQWPESNRFVTFDKNNSYLMARGSWIRDQNVESFIITGEDINFFNTRKILAEALLKSITDCPILIVEAKQVDLARDLMHPGIESNQMAANDILNKMSVT